MRTYWKDHQVGDHPAVPRYQPDHGAAHPGRPQGAGEDGVMARLEDICSINMGQSPESSSYNENGEGVPFFQGNADFGELHPKVRAWCNAPTKIAECGNILISVRAPTGALHIADKRCCIGRGLAALTVDETVCSPQYLWYGLEWISPPEQSLPRPPAGADPEMRSAAPLTSPGSCAESTHRSAPARGGRPPRPAG